MLEGELLRRKAIEVPAVEGLILGEVWEAVVSL